jgi:hypothetical protein
MAEFNFFCTEKDLISILQNALRNGYKIQQKTQLIEPVREYCESDEEIEASIRTGGHAYLLESAEFTRYPVSLLHYERDGKEFWTARPIKGGPVIEINFFFPFVKGEVSIIPCSLISFHSVIENPNTGKDEGAGDEVKKCFASLVSCLRKESRRVASQRKVAFVSGDADQMLLAGWKLARPF